MRLLSLPHTPHHTAIILNGEVNCYLPEGCDQELEPTPKPKTSLLGLKDNQDAHIEKAFIHKLLNYPCLIICDGAWQKLQNFLKKTNSTFSNEQKLIVLGDGDSIIDKPTHFLHITDQDTTDFEKALLFCQQNNIDMVDIYWGNGGSTDHLFGNIATAAKFVDSVCCNFYYYRQFYTIIKNNVSIDNAAGYTCSLIPLDTVTVATTTGLQYPMHDYAMSMLTQQSLRNHITASHASITADGSYILYLENG